jgi:hypothetical protein
MKKLTEEERRRRTRTPIKSHRKAASKGEGDQIGEQLRNEIDADATAIVETLWGKRPPGVEKLSEQEYLDFVRTEWPKPKFRNELLVQVGPMNFLSTFAAMVGMPLKDVLEWPLIETAAPEPMPTDAAGIVPPGV